MRATNKNLLKAKKAKQDEFYTRIEDVRREMECHVNEFAGKSVLCNCDGPSSAFRQYFTENFQRLGLARLVCTHIESEGQPATATIITSDAEKTILLEGNGDFRSPECVRYLEEADIVATNPPFSLFRPFIAQTNEYGKKFIVIGNMNAITHKDIFPMFLNNSIWLGVNHNKMRFLIPDDYDNGIIRVLEDGKRYAELSNVCWFTNLGRQIKHPPLSLTQDYEPVKHPRYDNFDAIEVSRLAQIPRDYYGVMGVPVTYMLHHCPDQFEILGNENNFVGVKNFVLKGNAFRVSGKNKYKRVLIRRKFQPVIVRPPKTTFVLKAA